MLLMSAATIAANSLQLVITAYSTVKTNRERSKRLVERCELVCSKLHQVIDERGEEAVGNRIERLQEAFEQVAIVVGRVGQQGWIKSLILSAVNVVDIENCHFILSDLISLFNLHELIDVAEWTKQNTDDRREDFKTLMGFGKKIQDGNEAILKELYQQGATIIQVAAAVNSISQALSLHNASPIGAPVLAPPIDEEALMIKTLPKLALEDTAVADTRNKFLLISAGSELSSFAQPQGEIMGRMKDSTPGENQSSTKSLPSSALDPIPSIYGFSYPLPTQNSNLSQYSHIAVQANSTSVSPSSSFNFPDSQSTMDHTPLALSLPLVPTNDQKGDGLLSARPRNITIDADVEVWLMHNVTESGVLLQHAEPIGRTDLATLRDWTDTQSLAEQTIRFDAHHVLLRLQPDRNPYLILSTYHPLAADKPTYDPNLDHFERRVFIVQSAKSATLVIAQAKSRVYRALFVWDNETTIHDAKQHIFKLVGKTVSSIRVFGGRGLLDDMTLGAGCLLFGKGCSYLCAELDEWTPHWS